MRRADHSSTGVLTNVMSENELETSNMRRRRPNMTVQPWTVSGVIKHSNCESAENSCLERPIIKVRVSVSVMKAHVGEQKYTSTSTHS